MADLYDLWNRLDRDAVCASLSLDRCWWHREEVIDAFEAWLVEHDRARNDEITRLKAEDRESRLQTAEELLRNAVPSPGLDRKFPAQWRKQRDAWMAAAIQSSIPKEARSDG